MRPMYQPESPNIGMIEKILSGEKTIESRWLQNRCAPWGKITVDDTIYFKYSGKHIVAQSTVRHVEYLENIDPIFLKKRLPLLASAIGLHLSTLQALAQRKRYAVLIALSHPIALQSFAIHKNGFGSMASWMTVEHIDQLRV